jgi:hypothetical protein
MANANMSRPTRNAIWWGARFKPACILLHVAYEEIIKATEIKSQGTLVRLGHGFKGQARPVEERTASEIKRFFVNHRYVARLLEEHLPVDEIIVPARFRFKAEYLEDFSYVNWQTNLFSLGGRAEGGGRLISMYEIGQLAKGGYAVERHVKKIAGIIFETRQKRHPDTIRSLTPSDLYNETENDLECLPQIYAGVAPKRS